MTGAQIVELREALGFTPKGFARVLNVELVTVQRWERSASIPSWAHVSAPAPPKGLALEVLTALRQVVLNVGDVGDERAARISHTAGRLRLGLGAMIAYGCLDLVNQMPRCECGLAGRCNLEGTAEHPCVFVRCERSGGA